MFVSQDGECQIWCPCIAIHRLISENFLPVWLQLQHLCLFFQPLSHSYVNTIFVITRTSPQTWWAAGSTGSRDTSHSSMGVGFSPGSYCLVATCLLSSYPGLVLRMSGAKRLALLCSHCGTNSPPRGHSQTVWEEGRRRQTMLKHWINAFPKRAKTEEKGASNMNLPSKDLWLMKTHSNCPLFPIQKDWHCHSQDSRIFKECT